MSQVENIERDRVEIPRLLAGAAKAIASVRYCWLATTSGETGRFSARPMGRIPSDLAEDEWTVRFITDGRSHKASDIRRAGEFALIFQHEADDAYIALAGAAALREGASRDPRWKDAYNVYFPSDQDRANAAFIEIEVERMELWIRGVTPEPFGLRPTVLERSSNGWRLISA